MNRWIGRNGVQRGLRTFFQCALSLSIVGSGSATALGEDPQEVSRPGNRLAPGMMVLLEQEMLEPVYAIYPGWSPELFSELPIGERIDFEQALFSRTAAQVEGAEALPEAFFIGGAVVVGLSGQGGTPFSLAATSFPDKVARVSEDRLAGLAAVIVAWISLGVTLVLVAIAAFAVFHPKAFLITSAATLAGCCLLSMPVGMLFLAA